MKDDDIQYFGTNEDEKRLDATQTLVDQLRSTLGGENLLETI